MFTRFALAALLVVVSELRVQAQGPNALPTDPTIAVAELWYVDQGILGAPEVTVFANGRVQARVGDGTIWGQVDVATVEHLVQALLHEDHLSTLTTEALEQDLQRATARTSLSHRIKGAADTIIRVRTAQQTYRLDAHAVGLLANRFPEVSAVQQVASAQNRLENIRAVVMAGGPVAADRLAGIAQARLQAQFGTQLAVGSEHLIVVQSLADGTIYCQFQIQAGEGADQQTQIVSLFESPGETPRVSVIPEGRRVQ